MKKCPSCGGQRILVRSIKNKTFSTYIKECEYCGRALHSEFVEKDKARDGTRNKGK